MAITRLTDWTKPQIDAACSAEHGRYTTELARHYARYFETHPELRGEHSYSARNLETALPSDWASLAQWLPTRERHRHYRSGKSSQILALGLMGVASQRDQSLAWMSKILRCGLGTVTSRPIFEYRVDRTLLGEEPRQTSIDFLVQTSEAVICAEAKWSERGFGSCSCSADEEEIEVPNTDEGDDGEPAIAECSKRILSRRKYWETAHELFALPQPSPGSYCPISTAYQAIRNVATVRALAAGRRAIFLLIFDEENPYFRACGDWPGWPAMLNATLPDSDSLLFRSVSWQRLSPTLPLDENARSWAREKHRLPA